MRQAFLRATAAFMIVLLAGLFGLWGALEPGQGAGIPSAGGPYSAVVSSANGSAEFRLSIPGPTGAIAVLDESVLFHFTNGDCRAGYGGPILNGECSVGLSSEQSTLDNPSVTGAGQSSQGLNTEGLSQRVAVDPGTYTAFATAGGPVGVVFNFTATFTIELLGYVPATWDAVDLA